MSPEASAIISAVAIAVGIVGGLVTLYLLSELLPDDEDEE